VKQILLLTGFLLLLSPLPALAQVTVNPAALQQLAGIEPPPPVAMAVSLPVAAPVHHWAHSAHITVRPLAPAQAVAGPKPPAPVQTAARVPPPALPAAPVALVFAPGSADLPANATAALKPFCTTPGKVAVDARAPNDPSDPSGAMRLSLARALAVQSALASCGVPPQNILPRAQGAVPGQNEDEAVIGGGPK